MKRVIVWMVFSSVLTACAFNAGNSMRPMDWSLAPLENTGDLQRCPTPIGLFANEGQSSDPEVEPVTLAYLLFLDHLRGFPVEAVQLSPVDGSNKLVARGVLEGVPLESFREVRPATDACDGRWQVVTDGDGVDAQLRTEAAIATSGLVIPLNEIYRISLELADDGALLVNVKWRGWLLGALVFPVRVDQQIWMRYPAYVAPVEGS